MWRAKIVLQLMSLFLIMIWTVIILWTAAPFSHSEQHSLSTLTPVSVDVASELQQQVVLDEGGQAQFGDHLVYAAVQEGPEPAPCQVLQGARSHRQREDRLVELFVLLGGWKHG